MQTSQGWGHVRNWLLNGKEAAVEYKSRDKRSPPVLIFYSETDTVLRGN